MHKHRYHSNLPVRCFCYRDLLLVHICFDADNNKDKTNLKALAVSGFFIFSTQWENQNKSWKKIKTNKWNYIYLDESSNNDNWASKCISTGCGKSFATFSNLRVSHDRQTLEPWFFFKRCVVKSCTNTLRRILIDSFRWCFCASQMDRSHECGLSHHLKFAEIV